MSSRLALPGCIALLSSLFLAGCYESGLPAGELPDLGVVPDLRGTCPAEPAFGRTTHHTMGPGSTALLAIADLDRDGRPDLIGIRADFPEKHQPDHISIAYAKPDGGFREPILRSFGRTLTGVVAGDLDGDGRPDLVVQTVEPSSILVLHNGADDQLSVAADILILDNTSELVLADLDVDGDLDIVANNAGYRAVLILLNQASREFTLRSMVQHHGVATSGIAVADIDGDRRPDLLVSNFNEKTITLSSGRGDGTFSAGTDHPTGGMLFDLAVGDVDGDRAPDVIAADFTNGRHVLFRNQGNGALAAPTPLPLPDKTPGQKLGIADVTGDGLPELFYVHPLARSAGVLTNAGGGRFRPARNFPIGREAIGIQVADLDGDGALDLVTTTVGGMLGNPGEPVYATILHNLCGP